MARRDREQEWMDDPDIPRNLHEAALFGVARINSVSGAAGALWRKIGPIARRNGPIRVLDLACGSGDIANELQRRATATGLAITVAGCDRSDVAIDIARQRAEKQAVGAEFFIADLFAGEFPLGYDVYICSLFLHHLSDDESVTLLRQMATGRALLVSDLRRTTRGMLLARWITPFITRSPVVLKDSRLSVKGAHTIEEVRALLRRAEIEGARIDKQWPQRFLVSWGF